MLRTNLCLVNNEFDDGLREIQEKKVFTDWMEWTVCRDLAVPRACVVIHSTESKEGQVTWATWAYPAERGARVSQVRIQF